MVNFLWDNIFKYRKDEKSLSKKLKQNFLFQDLTQKELQLLEKIVNVRFFRPGEIVFRQGEVGVGMYIIASGEVSIYVEEIIPQTGEARTSHVIQLGKGEFFGDLALVEQDSLRSATAVAHEEAQLIGFFKPDLMEIATRNPVAGVKILLRLGEVLGTRLKETTSRITVLQKALTPQGTP
jgi:CRP-like cAMP-binding protein